MRALSLPSPALQTKLAVNQPGDQYEQEADRVADQVMRMTAPAIGQRSCNTCQSEDKLQHKCAECEEEEKKTGLQRKQFGAGPQFAPPSVQTVLNSPGHPLDPGVRSFMEPRFGCDFSHVRVHNDHRASQSAKDVNAVAYTVGSNIVFDAGRYAPQTDSGRRLLGHELAHVVQQSHASLQASDPNMLSVHRARAIGQASGGPRPGTPPDLQRTCGNDLGTPAPDCAQSDAGVIGTQFLFVVNCDDLKSGEASKFTDFAAGLQAGAELRVHGFASIDGPADFNLALSCHRANRIADMLRGARPDCNVSAVFKHGAQSAPPSADFWRSVVVQVVTPGPQPQPGAGCPAVPTSTPSTCAARHDGYAAARRCFPLNSWLACVDRASADVCKAVDAFNFQGSDGTALEACMTASPGSDKGLARAKGAWFNNTNSCIWGHWRAALEAIHDPTRPVPGGLTSEWADAVTIFRSDGVGSDTCCRAHVVAEQTAIEGCGGYDDSIFGPLPTDVPGAPLCSNLAFLASGALPFTGNFAKVSDRISYGFLRCCTF